MKKIVSLTDFATKYKVKIVLDECAESVINGLVGHIFNDEKIIGFVFSPKELMTSTWTSIKKKAIKLGCILRIDGDGEGIININQNDYKQARFAIKCIQTKKSLSEKQKLNIKERSKCLKANSKKTSKTTAKTPQL